MKYWEKRQTDLYKAGEKQVNEYYRDLEKAFEQAKRDIRRVIDVFYGRYASENGISYAEAQRRLSKAEIGDLQDFIDRVFATLGEKDTEVINRSIKARVTRYEALELQIDAILRRLYARDYEQAGTQMLHDMYEDSYYRTWWNIDSYHGFHSEFAGIDQAAVDALVNYPFNGANFSNRLWKQKDYLQQRLMESLTTMMVQGADPKSLSRDFSKLFRQREYDAYRLLHTEYSFMCESASQAAYAEDDVPEYEYMATLDSRTCEICGKHDGEIVKMGKGKAGVNMPPLHPLCRCTTAPHYPDDMPEGGNRFARDADGNAIEVPEGMKYPEWKQKFIVDPKEKEYNDLKEKVHKLIKDEYTVKLNKGMQDKHIRGSSNFDPNRSELTVDPEELIKLYAGKSEIRFSRSGEWNHKEFFEHTDFIGIWKNEDGEEIPTKRGTFHYSRKKGIHIVPANPRKR